MTRIIKASVVLSMALFFSLVAFNNLVDYHSNWHFVQHVMSMDTTFKNPELMKRAIKDVEVQHFSYSAIIVWQLITAVVCWISGLWMLRCFGLERLMSYKKAKKLASFGLALGFLLYMVGFIDIGGEWFAMWQSTDWNGQAKAGLFLIINLLALIFLSSPDNE